MKHFFTGTIITFLIVHLFLNISIAQQNPVKVISEDDFLDNYQLYTFETYLPKDKLPDNVEIKKIPKNVLEKCDFEEDKI